MPKSEPVQSCGALKLASFPGSPVIKISKSANMSKFDTYEKSKKSFFQTVYQGLNFTFAYLKKGI